MLNLEFCHGSQFVQNEQSSHNSGTTTFSQYAPTEKTPVLPGTLTGTLYRGTQAVATFVFSMNGTFTPVKIGVPDVYPVGGTIDYVTGEMSITWNLPPGTNSAVISYEYNCEQTYNPDSIYPERPELFERFFGHDTIAELSAIAGTVCCWDFNSALGNTVGDKCDSLVLKVHEITNVLLKKGAAGYFWLASSPEVTSIFEMVAGGFDCVNVKMWERHQAMGLTEMSFRGILQQKWRVYADCKNDRHQILIGVNDRIQKPEHYARINVANYCL